MKDFLNSEKKNHIFRTQMSYAEQMQYEQKEREIEELRLLRIEMQEIKKIISGDYWDSIYK